MASSPEPARIPLMPLRKGFADLLSASFAVQLLGFATLLILPRFVSPEELGELKVIQSFVMLFGILAGFGFNTAVLKLCAENRTQSDRESILTHALRRTVVSSIAAIVLVSVFAKAGLLSGSQQLQTWLIVYSLVLPFDAFTNLFAAYLQSQKRIRDLATALLLVKAQSVCIIILATWKFGFEGFVIATIVGYAIGLVPFVRRIGLKAFRNAVATLPALFWPTATYTSLANTVNTLGRHADIYILGLFYHDPKDLGYYALAKIFLSGANVVTSTAQKLALPYLSEIATNESRFRSMMRNSQFQTFLTSIVVALAVHFVATFIVSFFYAGEYISAIRYLDILLIKYVVWSGFAIVGLAMIAMGKPGFNLIGACITAPVALGLSYYFLSIEGTVGIAWAQVAAATASLVVLSILYVVASRRHFNVP